MASESVEFTALSEFASYLQSEDGQASCTAQMPTVTMTQLAYYCAATGVRDPIHYDRLFAKEQGFRDAVANGSLRMAWMCYAAQALALPHSRVLSVRCEHRGPLYVGDQLSMELRASRIEAEEQVNGRHRTVSVVVSSNGTGVCDTGRIVLEER